MPKHKQPKTLSDSQRLALAKKLVDGARAAYTTPRGLVYGTVLYVYRNCDRARFEPDAGTTFAGGALKTLDAPLFNLEPTDVAFQPVNL